MLKYKYRFPIKGKIGDGEETEMFKRALDMDLDGPNGIYFCFMADKHAARTEGTTFNLDSDGRLESIDLNAYMELKEGGEGELIAAMGRCIQNIIDNGYGPYDFEDAQLTDIGSVQFVGIEGGMPKTMYHITEFKKASDIMEKGLIPGQGANSYNNIYDYVYLTDEENLPAWLSVLPTIADPVVFEIDAGQIEGLEQGRVYNDRPYMGKPFGEFRTETAIPASAIRPVTFDGEFGKRVLEALTGQFDRAVGYVEYKKAKGWAEADLADPVNETLTGLERLNLLGALDKDGIGEMLHERKVPELMEDLIREGLAPVNTARYVLDTYGYGKGDSWADGVSDGFARGVEQIQAECPDIHK